MANVNIYNASGHSFGNVPYGNVSVLKFALATNPVGAPVSSRHDQPLAVGDVVDLGPLPEGFRLEDAQIVVTTGMTADVTGSLGFKYEDGEDSSRVPQDAAYFGAGLNLSAAGRVRASGSKLVAPAKPARLILTLAGADNAKASEISVLVYGEQLGSL